MHSRWLLWTGAVIVFLLGQAATAYAQDIPLHVVGNQVLTGSGQPFIPEGISVYGGLEATDYKANTANVYAQIMAAHMYWHANTIRLQVAESNLLPASDDNKPYAAPFLAALKKQVRYARSLHMAVVINDQTEFTSNTPSPTTKTIRFWRVIATQFKSQPDVIFDIFNEPRLTSLRLAAAHPLPKDFPLLLERPSDRHRHVPAKLLPPQQAWQLWQNGGRLNGSSYVGMQALIDQIRAAGAQNIIWVEGTYEARQLPPDRYLLHGTNLVYALHHPNLNKPASWQRIGDLAARQPVVEGEWSQYQSAWAECYSKAYTNAPLYLQYLHNHNIGVIAWSLQANSLVAGDGRLKPTNLNKPYDPKQASALQKPTKLTPNYTCTSAHSGQGVGELLQRYFAANSVNYPM